MKQVNLLGKVMLMMILAFTISCDEINDILGDDGKDVNITSGLMAYYTFDNSTAEDMTDNGLDGTFMNNPSFVTETVNGSGKAVFFNSQKEQYMSIPYNPFNGIENYSATMWVKDFGYGSFLKIVNSSTNPRFDFYYDEDGLFKFRLSPYSRGMGTFTYDAKSLIDGSWHMIAITRAAGLCKLYVDGSLVASEELDSYSTSEDPGMLVDNHMKFDNLRLYNREIDAKEVKAIYDLER